MVFASVIIVVAILRLISHSNTMLCCIAQLNSAATFAGLSKNRSLVGIASALGRRPLNDQSQSEHINGPVNDDYEFYDKFTAGQ